jgi:5-hydroxyisourate hydrolase
MPGLSFHAVDVALGRPASGMRVTVFRLDPPSPANAQTPQNAQTPHNAQTRVQIADGVLTASGTLDHPIIGETLLKGTYEAIFHMGDFFARTRAGSPDPVFLDLAPFRFNIADPAQHYHLPLKFTEWGYSLFRGA